MVKFEEFVEASKSVFKEELQILRGRGTPKLMNDQLPTLDDPGLTSVVRERDALKAENESLREEVKSRSSASHSTEEQLLFIRKQAQVSIEEGRQLRSKLHLAEQAQSRAQQTERDYEEVVAMLENEVAQLKMQLAKSDGVSMQKRLAVLVCQLKKAESGKKTYEVATEKLMRYVEHSVDVLTSSENSPRNGSAAESSKSGKKSAGAATAANATTGLAAEGRDVIKVVRSLMETVPLPFGWEEAYTAEGVKYYINHLNQTTNWTHPVSCMEHQTSSKSAIGQNAATSQGQPASSSPQHPGASTTPTQNQPPPQKDSKSQQSTSQKPSSQQKQQPPQTAQQPVVSQKQQGPKLAVQLPPAQTQTKPDQSHTKPAQPKSVQQVKSKSSLKKSPLNSRILKMKSSS